MVVFFYLFNLELFIFFSGFIGFLFRFSLQLFGTYSNPMLGNKGIGSSQIGANSSIPKPTSTKPQTSKLCLIYYAIILKYIIIACISLGMYG